MAHNNWKKGTERFLTAYQADSDPNTVHIHLTAQDDEGNNVIIKKEMSTEELAEQLSRDERCKVVGTVPFEIRERQEQPKQYRRAS